MVAYSKCTVHVNTFGITRVLPANKESILCLPYILYIIYSIFLYGSGKSATSLADKEDEVVSSLQGEALSWWPYLAEKENEKPGDRSMVVQGRSEGVSIFTYY